MHSDRDFGLKDEVWIGLVALSGAPTNPALQGSNGAYSNVLARCHNKDEFRASVSHAASSLDLRLEELLWADPLTTRVRRHEVEEYLLDLAREVESEGCVRFGVFHTWEKDDD